MSPLSQTASPETCALLMVEEAYGARGALQKVDDAEATVAGVYLVPART